jgi:hypothetical protein
VGCVYLRRTHVSTKSSWLRLAEGRGQSVEERETVILYSIRVNALDREIWVRIPLELFGCLPKQQRGQTVNLLSLDFVGASPSTSIMVNTLRYKIMTESVVNAIGRYSQEFYAATWLELVEDEVFYQVSLDDSIIYDFYTTHELACMKDMIREGLWVKWREGQPRLYRWKKMSIQEIDFDNCINGAD